MSITYDLGTNTVTENVPDELGNIICIDQNPASMSLYRLVKRELATRRPGGGGKARIRQAIIREMVGAMVRLIPRVKDMNSWDKHQECNIWHNTFRQDTIILSKDGVVIFESKGEEE